MWILKTFKELLEYLKSLAMSKVSSIKTSLYTTIPHEGSKASLTGVKPVRGKQDAHFGLILMVKCIL